MREKGLNFEMKEEAAWQPSDELIVLNPLMELPVLVEDNGLVVCDPQPICEYLEEVYTQHNFIGTTAGEHAEVRRICSWLDNKFYHEVSRPLLYERYFSRFAGRGSASSEVIRACKQNIRNHMEYLSGLVGRRGWIAGERITLGDMTASAHLSCLDYFEDVPWQEFPRVKDWYSIMKSRPSLRAILNERVPATKPPSYYEDPDF